MLNNSTFNEQRIFSALAVLSVGALLTIIAVAVLFGVTVSIMLLGVGGAMLTVGFLDLTRHLHVKDWLCDWKNDESGLGWQLLIFCVGIVAFALVWFFAAWPTDTIYNYITDMYGFTGLSLTAVNFVRGLILLLPATGLFLLGIWLWVNTNRREAQQ